MAGIVSPEKGAIRQALEEGRERTWLLADGLDDASLTTAAADYLSPPVWDLGHIANFEELWLVQRILDCTEMHAGYNDTYDAFKHPRQERPDLDLLDRDGVRAYMREVRARVLDVLEQQRFTDCPRLLEAGFVYWMIILHEHQHQETLLQSMQMRRARYRPQQVRALPGPASGASPAWLDVPAGPFAMGQMHGPGVYDNEAPAHEVDVPAFQIACHPVTCGEYLGFIEAGGYDGLWWSERGRAWLDETDHHAPLYWEEHGGAWHRIGPLGAAPVQEVADEILCHVTFFEAEAYAAWRQARLPTEAEWEKAARYDPQTEQVVGRNPWGDAPADTGRTNIDQLGWRPSRIGAYPDGASPVGAQHMIGDVWEWCSDGWRPYPGFEAFPYKEYSEAFFGGDYRVLRGGSWATRAGCAHATFRNWDHPYRRQIFSGIRLARDTA